MKLYAGRFGLAGSITAGLLYTAFVMLIKTRPLDTLKFMSSIHMIPRLEAIAPYIKITPAHMVLGVATHAAIAFLFFWFFAIIYNLMQR